MSAGEVLAPSIARTFYNVADALIPPTDGPGGGDVDLLEIAEASLAALDSRDRRRIEWALRLLEWQSRFRLGPSFSWLPRDRRREQLRSWEESRWSLQRESFRQLADIVSGAWAAHETRSSQAPR